MKLRMVKALVVLYVLLDWLTPGGPLPIFTADSEARGASPPVPSITGPWDPGAAPVVINTLIGQINAILIPAGLVSPAATAVSNVNSISLTPAVTGGLATIGLQPGADVNAGIQIAPNGAGNIVLLGQSNSGVIQFGNQASFVSAPGLSPYPGQVPGIAAMQGVHSTVQGVLLVKDWLGFTRGVPVY